MLNVTHGKHISIWELREVQENHTGKILLSLMLRAQVILCSFLSLCLPSEHWFTFVNHTPGTTHPLLRLATNGGHQLMRNVMISWRSLLAARIACPSWGSASSIGLLESCSSWKYSSNISWSIFTKSLWKEGSWGILSLLIEEIEPWILCGDQVGEVSGYGASAGVTECFQS